MPTTTVRELIAKLSQFDGDLVVLVPVDYDNDTALTKDIHISLDYIEECDDSYYDTVNEDDVADDGGDITDYEQVVVIS